MENKDTVHRILLVDDSYEFYQIVNIALESTFTVDYAEDGFIALKMARRNQYDLILCDVFMPIINGITLMHEFRKKKMKLPFLFVTGNSNDNIIRDAFQGGAFNFIEKPFDKDDLIKKINKAISLDKKESPLEIEDQDKAYIYNTLKTYYFDVDKMLRIIDHLNLPVSVIFEELDKKTRLGKCMFDEMAEMKNFHRRAS